MTNFKGIKGKWIVKVPKGTNGWVEVIYPDGYCVVRTKDYIEKKEDYGKKKFLKNSINHAKLIAHAPEMLEILEYFVDNNMLSITGEEMAQQLIKKATE